MRKVAFLLVLALSYHISNAQVPQTFPYQAVARDSFGTPIPNQLMRIKVSILDSISTGTVLYSESDTITTDDLGMFTLSIGDGPVDAGAFTSINWASAAKFLKIELDPQGGTSYINMGTSQLLSVPFALHALSSGTTNVPTKRVPYGGTTGLLSDTLFTRGDKGFTKIITKDTSKYTAALLVGTNNVHTLPGHEVSILSIDSQNNYGAVTVTPYTASLNSFYNNFSGQKVLYVDSSGLHYVFGSGNSYIFPNSKGNSGEVLKTDGSGNLSWQPAAVKNRFGITIDGLGDVITTGSKGFTQIPYSGTITGWTILADQAGSCVIDVKKSTYSSFPTTTSVAGSALPTLSSAQKNRNISLSGSGWGSTSISAGDTFEFVVNSATTVKRVTLIIETTME